jgi:hypothetical protein
LPPFCKLIAILFLLNVKGCWTTLKQLNSDISIRKTSVS